MASIKLTVGQAIVKFLDNQYHEVDGISYKYIQGFFTLFGHGCVLGVGEALANYPHSLKVYQGKNEQGMAHAAASFAKTTYRRQILPVISSIGPGAANMVTAAATATVNNIPLLIFVGDSFASRQPSPVLQQIEHGCDPNITTNDAFKAVSKYFDRITRPEMLMSSLKNAIRMLTDPKEMGAVVIALPQDVQSETFDFPTEFFDKKINKMPRPEVDKTQIMDALKVISNSLYPLIIVGGGARYSGASTEIADLANFCNIPFAETQAGKSTISSQHLLNLGGLGVTGNSAANLIAAKADTIIAIGTRLSDFTTASKSLFPNAKLVAININSLDAYKMDALAVVGDALVAVKDLKAKLLSMGYKSRYLEEVNIAKRDWQLELSRLKNIRFQDETAVENLDMEADCITEFRKISYTGLAQTTAIGIIQDTIAPSSIIVGASGSLPGCLQRMWECSVLGTYNMEYGYSCMGYEIAGALGSKIAEPTREVYAMVGDGSFLMLHSEMITALQEGLKINILLFDNGGFGCINNLQMSKGIKGLCTEFRKRQGNDSITNGAFLPIDYAMVAAGYGYLTATVRNEKELLAALEMAKNSQTGVLIDIKVLPKSMTHGYDGGWWNVGIAVNSTSQKAKEELKIKNTMLETAKKY